MKRAIVLLGVLSSLAAGFASASAADSRAYCQQISGGSYRSEAYCLEREAEAYAAFSARRYVEQRILDYCNQLSGGSWRSLEYCITREEEARARLGR
ncbi:MAG TPA: hypothetical protein VGV13_14310 [Methylomirabilota bacterium]|jgi:hypothetical protein|nr:hypothetical protein [Methylomirabilota bacterium]